MLDRRLDVLVFAGLILLIAASRLPVAPEHLFYHDSGNLAFALEQFNPLLHQPQPPGYPLFVGLIRLIHLFLSSPETVLLAGGILGLAVASWFLWRFTSEAFSPRAGWFAIVLLAFHPIAWYGGLTNPVRIYFAVVMTGAAFLGWRAWQGHRADDFVWTAAWVGVASGFRPSTAVLLLPLLLVLGLRQKRWRTRIAGWSVYALGLASWVSVLFWVSGGIVPYLQFLAGYSQEQFGGSSLLYGAGAPSAWEMVETALVWTFFGALAWVMAVPFAMRRLPQHRPAEGAWRFLAICYGPAFAFLALVHVADPDHTLVVIPAVCVAGAVVLSRATYNWNPVQTAALLLLLAVAGSYLFRHPPEGRAMAASFRVVRYQRDHMRTAVRELRHLLEQGDAEIISFRPAVSWRNLAYYFRNASILVVDPDAASPVWQANAQGDALRREDGAVVLHSDRRAVLLLPPPGSGIRRQLLEAAPFERYGSLLHGMLPEGTEFAIGGIRFRVDGAARQ